MPPGRPRKVLSPLTPTENLIQNMIEEVDDSTVEVSINKQPKITDAEWTDYVLSLLREDEKDEVNSYPKTEGLKRIAQLLLGPIVSSTSRVVNASPDFACVTHSLLFKNDDHEGWEWTAAADAIPGQPPYDKFLTSIAATRAYGRALRDALNLKNISVAEEVEEEQMIKPAQKRGIELLCKNMKLDIEKLLQLIGTKFDKLEKLTWVEATLVMSKLNKFNNRHEEIPNEVLNE